MTAPRPCATGDLHQPCSPAAICGSEHRKARHDILDLSGECSRPYAEARTPGRAYDIMRSQGESLSAGEGARHVGHYQDTRAHLPDTQWWGRVHRNYAHGGVGLTVTMEAPNAF